jgi:Uma2 family endonuclease
MSPTATARRLPYTWDDYRAWPDDERWEIVEGESYAISPAPTMRHQHIVAALMFALMTHFAGKSCRPIVSPVDVKLDDLNVVQPDLIVVCRKEQMKRTHVEGAPTLASEVLSPSSALHDRAVKLPLYARHGVAEVWLVTPYPHCVEVFLLDGPGYRLAGVWRRQDTLRSPTFPDLAVDLAPVFDFPLEPGEETPAVREPPARYGASRA